MFKNYHIDGNKEMIAIGMMNIAGSCTSCYLTTGPFSRSAVNYNAGCKMAMSNVVMAIATMKPQFSSRRLTRLTLFCMSACIRVVFGSVEIGLVLVVVYRNVEQYPNASNVPGILILEIDAPIYFANTNYLRERITRWINDEEDGTKSAGESSLQYVILDMTAVGNIETSGISMFEVVKKLVDRRGLQLVLANPGSEVMKKMNKSELIENTCQEWIYLTVAEAVAACNLMLHSTKPNPGKDQEPAAWNNVDGFGWLQCEFMYQKAIST
ncbi:unnamed protein product [Prunus armeniaca]